MKQNYACFLAWLRLVAALPPGIDDPVEDIKDWAAAEYELPAGMEDPMKNGDKYVTDSFRDYHRLNYWVRMYRGPNCTDPFEPPEGSYSNFGCTDHCFGVGPTRSILIQAPWYDEAPKGVDIELYYKEDPFWKLHPQLISNQGPVVLAYTFDCKEEYFVDKVVIPSLHVDWCHTFEDEDKEKKKEYIYDGLDVAEDSGAVRKFHLRFQRQCGRIEFGRPPGTPPGPPDEQYFDFETGHDSGRFKDWMEHLPPPKPQVGSSGNEEFGHDLSGDGA